MTQSRASARYPILVRLREKDARSIAYGDQPSLHAVNCVDKALRAYVKREERKRARSRKL